MAGVRRHVNRSRLVQPRVFSDWRSRANEPLADVGANTRIRTSRFVFSVLLPASAVAYTRPSYLSDTCYASRRPTSKIR